MRKLKGLEPFISVSVVNPLMLENGWTFDDGFQKHTEIRSINMNFCISFISTPIHTTAEGFSAPCCGTKRTTPSSATNQQKSSACSIPRLMRWARRAGDYYPPALQTKIDELNGWIYDTVNNGVYKAGFATSRKPTTRRWRKCLNRWRDWSRF